LARLADSANTIHGFILNDGELIRASRARGVGESFAPCAHRNGTARIVCWPLTVSVGALAHIGHSPRQLESREQVIRDRGSMPDQPLEDPAVLLPASIPRLEHHTGEVFGGFHGVTRLSPTAEVFAESFDEPQELHFIVERDDYLVAPFVAFWIMSVVAHNVAVDVVIVRVYDRHVASVDRRAVKCEPPRTVERPRTRLTTLRTLVALSGVLVAPPMGTSVPGRWRRLLSNTYTRLIGSHRARHWTYTALDLR
jgi:hypothetical protein